MENNTEAAKILHNEISVPWNMVDFLHAKSGPRITPGKISNQILQKLIQTHTSMKYYQNSVHV